VLELYYLIWVGVVEQEAKSPCIVVQREHQEKSAIQPESGILNLELISFYF
jgi:hypothetical protein